MCHSSFVWTCLLLKLIQFCFHSKLHFISLKMVFKKMVWFKRVDDLYFSDFMDITGNVLSLISKWKQWSMSCGWYLNHNILSLYISPLQHIWIYTLIFVQIKVGAHFCRKTIIELFFQVPISEIRVMRSQWD